ncbi:MAG: type II toxin-antitoxin system VapC family toxin [Pseudolysinimonas sp.]
MIGVDTNVLVRHLVHDDPSQVARVDSFFADRSIADPAYVSLICLVETTWVLGRRYGFTAEVVTRTIQDLLDVEEVVIQAPDVVRRALRDASVAGTAFADSVIAQLGIDAGCDYTVTFDRKAADLPGMLLLE